MTKQEVEQRRSEISKTVRLFLRNAYEAGRAGRPLKEDEKVKGFQGALSLQGVVMKAKCPDCAWSEFKDEAVVMAPCYNCNSTGYIEEPLVEKR